MRPSRPIPTAIVALLLLTAPSEALAQDGAAKLEGKKFIFHGGEEMDYSDRPAGLIRCLKKRCMQGNEDPEQFSWCERDACTDKNRVSFRLDSLHYDGKSVSMHGTLSTEVAMWGAHKKDPIYLGLSLFKKDGSVIDVPPQTIRGAKRNGPVQLSAKPGKGVIGYIVAAWGKKVKPCQVDRPGCKKLGFVLDEPLSAAPPEAYSGWYDENKPFFARLPGGTGKVNVRVLDAGAGAEIVEQIIEDSQAYLDGHLKLYGRPAAVVGHGTAKNPRELIEILYKHEQDAALAEGLGKHLKKSLKAPKAVTVTPGKTATINIRRVKLEATHWPQAPADFIIAAGKKPKKK